MKTGRRNESDEEEGKNELTYHVDPSVDVQDEGGVTGADQPRDPIGEWATGTEREVVDGGVETGIAKGGSKGELRVELSVVAPRVVVHANGHAPNLREVVFGNRLRELNELGEAVDGVVVATNVVAASDKGGDDGEARPSVLPEEIGVVRQPIEGMRARRHGLR
jgi:hypothetical protein